ncbi:MAG: galactokinase [Trueperaceae bacterium]
MSHGQSRAADLAAGFRRLFAAEPELMVRAPGRVNLIGEHTDYNDGFVLPMAIDREVLIALRPRTDAMVRVHSLDLEERAEFSLDEFERDEGWAEYLKGVAWSLTLEGHRLSGFDGVLNGSVPRGSGLSSSAALELAAARAFRATSGFPWDPARMARVCQRAENEWLGVGTGIMDQLASAAGNAGHALLIDCRSLETTAVPLPGGTAVLVLDTGTRRKLVGSAYNERREQCEAVARHFGVPALRDVTPERLEAASRQLAPLLYRRARHVVSENERTLAAARAMRSGDAATVGQLMSLSHDSLRDDFEVSSDALDAIVGGARAEPDCFGARLTGAGFGGCAVALVASDAAAGIGERVMSGYREATGLAGRAYLCRAAGGASDIAVEDIALKDIGADAE